ncbi:MAG: LVIVD repeat-containing protein [Candidatus Hodarchaeota archaeon]
MKRNRFWISTLSLIFFILFSITTMKIGSFSLSITQKKMELLPLSETVTGGDAYDVWVDEVKETAYVTCGYRGLRIFNVSNPSNLSLLAHIPETPAVINTGHSTAYAHQLLVRNEIVFIGDGPGGLKIINCSDPKNPLLLSQFTEGYSWDIKLIDDVAFVANGWNNMGNPGMMVVNVTDLTNPLQIYNHMYSDITDLEISGDRVYLAGYSAGILILDITNYSNPVELGRYTERLDSFDVEVVDNLVFQSSWDYGLQILEVNDPTSIKVISEFSSFDGNELASIHIDTEFAYLAAMTDGIIVLNISDPNNPQEVSRYSDLDGAFGIFARDDLVFVADQEKGLIILKLVLSSSNQQTTSGLDPVMVLFSINLIILFNEFPRRKNFF